MTDRRRFLFASGSLAAAAACGYFAPSKSNALPLREVRIASHALGSEMSILALHADEAIARKAIMAAFEDVEQIESVMSIYRSGSQISRLNKEGKLEAPHPYMVTVLEHAQKLAAETGGAFDVTVQPLWQLYSDANARGALPSEADVAQAKARIDFRNLHLSPHLIRLDYGAQITLNGIAQGFAVDRAVAVLRSFGIEHALIDTGEHGSIGEKSGAQHWRVGIQHPRQPDALSAVMNLDGRCLSTSGDYATFFSPDFSNHHIFDPHTGHSPPGLASVSVLAASGMEADALSTAVFVLGAERGVRLLQARGAEGYFISKAGGTVATPGIQKLICNTIS